MVELTVEDCETIIGALSLLATRVDNTNYGEGAKTEEERRALYKVRQNRKACIAEAQSKIREIRRGLKDR